jgi:hypothetical protein
MQQLLSGKAFVVMSLQGTKERVMGVEGLHPHLGNTALSGLSTRSTRGLHQQRK